MEFKVGVHHSPDLERAILGICVLNSACFGRIYSLVDENCFYGAGNRLVFQVLGEMYKSGLPIDVFTVSDQILRVKGISEVEGYNPYYFIARLTQDVVSDAHLEYHSYIVKNMWMEREIIKLTDSGAKDLDGDISQKVAALQKKLSNLVS